MSESIKIMHAAGWPAPCPTEGCRGWLPYHGPSRWFLACCECGHVPLKPCPFCGSEEISWEGRDCGYDTWSCRGCGCDAPWEGSTCGGAESKQRTAILWNTRAISVHEKHNSDVLKDALAEIRRLTEELNKAQEKPA